MGNLQAAENTPGGRRFSASREIIATTPLLGPYDSMLSEHPFSGGRRRGGAARGPISGGKSSGGVLNFDALRNTGGDVCVARGRGQRPGGGRGGLGSPCGLVGRWAATSRNGSRDRHGKLAGAGNGLENRDGDGPGALGHRGGKGGLVVAIIVFSCGAGERNAHDEQQQGDKRQGEPGGSRDGAHFFCLITCGCFFLLKR